MNNATTQTRNTTALAASVRIPARRESVLTNAGIQAAKNGNGYQILSGGWH